MDERKKKKFFRLFWKTTDFHYSIYQTTIKVNFGIFLSILQMMNWFVKRMVEEGVLNLNSNQWLSPSQASNMLRAGFKLSEDGPSCMRVLFILYTAKLSYCYIWWFNIIFLNILWVLQLNSLHMSKIDMRISKCLFPQDKNKNWFKVFVNCRNKTVMLYFSIKLQLWFSQKFRFQ